MSADCPADLASRPGINEAFLNVTVDTNVTVQLMTQSTECYQCPLIVRDTIVGPKSGVRLIVDATFATVFQVVTNASDKQSNQSEILCQQMDYHFGEWGDYLLKITKQQLRHGIVANNVDHNVSCILETIKEPTNIDLYVVWAALFYLSLCLIWLTGTFIYRRYNSRPQEDERLLVSELGSPSERSGSSHIWSFSADGNVSRLHERLHSLDTFRGMCVVMMIFIDFGGGKYWYIEHSKWNGLTFPDVVFPWFMWMMGVSIALSLQSQLRRAVPKKRIFAKIVRRSIVLFVLDLMINSKHDLGCLLAGMRIPGVLQRASICYLVVATMQLLAEKPGDVYQFEFWAPLRDLIPYWHQWIFVVLLVSGHTLITFFLHVPGCPTGYLGPGGLHMNASFKNCTGGAAGYIDRLVLGNDHLYQRPTFKDLYQTTLPYDPEGILGFLTSVLIVFLGLQAGKIITMYPMYRSRVKRWLGWAVLTGAIGATLCQLKVNDGWIPVNKNLWSLSFVLITGSMAFVVLSVFYVLIDVLHVWTGIPFYYSGMNPILIYVGHEATGSVFPWQFPVPDTHLYHLCMDLWGTSLWVFISIWLYYCNFFVSI